MDENLSNIITLNDENGDEVRFEFLDLVEYEGEKYVVLLPEDGDGEVVILQLDDTDLDSEEDTFLGVEDEETLQAVFGIFKERNKDGVSCPGEQGRASALTAVAKKERTAVRRCAPFVFDIKGAAPPWQQAEAGWPPGGGRGPQRPD